MIAFDAIILKSHASAIERPAPAAAPKSVLECIPSGEDVQFQRVVMTVAVPLGAAAVHAVVQPAAAPDESALACTL